jgi:hypothetical protein
MAEGGGGKTRREKPILATAVDMGLLADEVVISVIQMCTDDRIAYRNRIKNLKQKVLLQTVDQLCVPLYFRYVQCFHIPSIILVWRELSL